METGLRGFVVLFLVIVCVCEGAILLAVRVQATKKDCPVLFVYSIRRHAWSQKYSFFCPLTHGWIMLALSRLFASSSCELQSVH